MKKHILTAVIIILLSGCTSMKKDIDSAKLGKVDTEQKKEKEMADPASIDKKIGELERLNDWFSYPLAQNKIQKTGSPVIQPYSQGGIYFEVYYDENELKNYDYYDRKIHVDFAWKLDPVDKVWEKTASSKPIQEGLLYINPAYKVAIYYYLRQEGAFDVFKVRIMKPQQE
ncbi:MAG: lipoprotein [Treponema sp.]|nr:lipoprotein [Treponema sp.]